MKTSPRVRKPSGPPAAPLHFGGLQFVVTAIQQLDVTVGKVKQAAAVGPQETVSPTYVLN